MGKTRWDLSAATTKVVDSDATARALKDALGRQWAEDGPALALADRLQELGVSPLAASRYSGTLRLLATPWEYWAEADIGLLIYPNKLGVLRDALAVANGRRKARTLTLDDCLHACLHARWEGWAVYGGGTVANAYGYPAAQTGFVAAACGRRLRYTVGEVSAARGTSVSNQLAGLTARATAADWREWAAAGFEPPAQ